MKKVSKSPGEIQKKFQNMILFLMMAKVFTPNFKELSKNGLKNIKISRSNLDLSS
jgi:hypothetical protein